MSQASQTLTQDRVRFRDQPILARRLLLPNVQALAALPPDWVEELRQATARADLYRGLDLIDQIREQNPALADTLADLMERYEYQKILSLIEETGGYR